MSMYKKPLHYITAYFFSKFYNYPPSAASGRFPLLIYSTCRDLNPAWGREFITAMFGLFGCLRWRIFLWRLIVLLTCLDMILLIWPDKDLQTLKSFCADAVSLVWLVKFCSEQPQEKGCQTCCFNRLSSLLSKNYDLFSFYQTNASIFA